MALGGAGRDWTLWHSPRFRPSLGTSFPITSIRFREHQGKQALETTIRVRCLRQ
jgi:hypothetical protein